MFKWFGMFMAVIVLCFGLLYVLMKMSDEDIKYPGQDRLSPELVEDTLK